jgi:hypothetical protein
MSVPLFAALSAVSEMNYIMWVMSFYSATIKLKTHFVDYIDAFKCFE